MATSHCQLSLRPQTHAFCTETRTSFVRVILLTQGPKAPRRGASCAHPLPGWLCQRLLSQMLPWEGHLRKA